MVKRLSSKSDEEIVGTVAQMIHTVKIENEIETGTSYFDLFKGLDRRRTEICCVTFAGQMLAGAQFAYGPTYFFEQAGMSPDDAYKVGLGDTALSFCGTVGSWFLLTYFGRRPLYISGIGFLTFVLLLIGIVSVSSKSDGALWAQAALCLLWQVGYSLTVGPICYTIISETSAIRLRAKTVCLARNTYNVTAIICAILEPYMINPTEWDWKGKTAFFWCGSAALTTVWAYYRLPECKGRTYEELDLLFAEGVSARRFGTAKVDAYASASTVVIGQEATGKTGEKN
jgi:SP family general alpha glucoside:H+ symporter-like MFS transporter